MNRISEVKRTMGPRCASAWLDVFTNSEERCVFCKDITGRYLQVNTAFCRWLGRPAASIVGRTAFDLWPPLIAEALTAADWRARAGTFVEKEELCPNAHELRTLRTAVMPVKDARGRIAGILGSFTDVTEERHPDGLFQRAQRRAVLGRLKTCLAEERQQLLPFTQGGAVSPLARELAEQMAAVAALSAKLSRQVNGHDRADQKTSEAGNLNAAVEEVATHFRSVLDLSVHLKVFPGEDLPAVQVPHSQLAQILFNLCLNARAAMPQGGRLTVETDQVPHASALSVANGALQLRRRAGPHVRLRVSNTGRVSNQRRRAHRSAGAIESSVGLAVVQDVVRRHGGWVECAGEPDAGSTFSVFLPAVEETMSPSAALGIAQVSNSTVLLADNDPCIVSLCQTILRSSGYRVRTASCGKEAADVYRRERGEIGVVVLDQNMPEMSGVDVLTELAATDPAVRVLFMSGAPLEDVPPALARNLRGFINKPFRAAELLAAVRSAFAAE